MQYDWIRREGSDTVIIFFNGWGMDIHSISTLGNPDVDCCLISDYTDEVLHTEDFDRYQHINLIAWSMGVWAAEFYFPQEILPKLDQCVAINGTPYPKHDEWGIPSIVFNRTLETWDDKVRKKFWLRTVGGKSAAEHLSATASKRSTISQQEELRFVNDHYNPNYMASLPWSHAFCGEQDLIFPLGNQKTYWQNKAKTMEMPHFPFLHLQSWSELLIGQHKNETIQ